VMLNDPTYVEASRAFAARVLARSRRRRCPDRLGLCAAPCSVGRTPRNSPPSASVVTERAVRLPRRSCRRQGLPARSASTPPPAQADPAELAAWTARHPRDPRTSTKPSPVPTDAPPRTPGRP
jgi:hypothetical protein